MALIDCPECGHRVSTQAAACPSCGAPVKGGLSPAAQRPGQRVVDAGLLGRIATVIGAWLVVPWLVRLLAFIAGIVMLVVMFRSGR